MEALGGNLQTIAAAKAGIFKHGRPAIIAHQPHAAVVMPVLQTHAQELGAPLIMADAVVSQVRWMHLHGKQNRCMHNPKPWHRTALADRHAACLSWFVLDSRHAPVHGAC